MKKYKLLIVSLMLSMSSFAASADTLISPDPRAKMDGANKVVAIYGNSFTHYNNNVNTRLRDLARSVLADKAKDYSFRGITISSGRLGWHLPNLKFQNTLQKWDVVIFQGNSTEPISAKQKSQKEFTDAATEMAEIAHKAGSKVVYFMTWAKLDSPEQTQKLADAYIDIAKKTGGYVAPVGLAFANSMKKHPDIRLYHSDGTHPSLAGTYLAACVLFSTLYNQSPVGGALPVDGDMSKETALALQQVAWETYNDFHNQP